MAALKASAEMAAAEKVETDQAAENAKAKAKAKAEEADARYAASVAAGQELEDDLNGQVTDVDESCSSLADTDLRVEPRRASMTGVDDAGAPCLGQVSGGPPAGGEDTAGWQLVVGRRKAKGTLASGAGQAMGAKRGPGAKRSPPRSASPMGRR